MLLQYLLCELQFEHIDVHTFQSAHVYIMTQVDTRWLLGILHNMINVLTQFNKIETNIMLETDDKLSPFIFYQEYRT